MPSTTVKLIMSQKKQYKLSEWKALKRRDIKKSSDSDLQLIINTVGTGELIEIRYNGGSNPGAKRNITPTKVYQIREVNRIYVEGYCALRNDNRTFNYEFIELENNKLSKKPSHIKTNIVTEKIDHSKKYDPGNILLILIILVCLIIFFV